MTPILLGILALLLLLSYLHERHKDREDREAFQRSYMVLKIRGENRKAEMDKLNRRPEDGPERKV